MNIIRPVPQLIILHLIFHNQKLIKTLLNFNPNCFERIDFTNRPYFSLIANLAFETKIDQTKLNELKSLLTHDTAYRSTLSNSITLKQGNNHFDISDNNPEAKIHTFIAKLAKANNYYRLF